MPRQDSGQPDANVEVERSGVGHVPSQGEDLRPKTEKA